MSKKKRTSVRRRRNRNRRWKKNQYQKRRSTPFVTWMHVIETIWILLQIVGKLKELLPDIFHLLF